MVVQNVAEQTGWTIVVDNKPGANSILGADLAAKAPPDGYTFLTVIAAHAANATLYAGKLPFDVVKSFAPVSLVGIAPLIMGLRLKVGLAELALNQPVSGGIQVSKLSSLDRDLLKDTLAVVKRFKQLLSQRFRLDVIS